MSADAVPMMRETMARQKGFTLIEIAIVLIVLSLLLGGLLGPISTQIESRERQRASQELNTIMEALYGFAAVNGRLPCPDTNGDGMPNPNSSGACTAPPPGVVPSVPWVVLGTSRADPWGTTYRYRVMSPAFTTVDDGICGPFDGNNDGDTADLGDIANDNDFDLYQEGNITIRDAPIGTPGSSNVATDVAAVIISFGSNRNDPGLAVNGDLSPLEQDNAESPPDNEFISRSFSRADASEFDDLVLWVSPNVIKNRMVMAGRLP
jgi:prepilin-type N-terminal cleavage/methylation domain-containing protein